MPKTKYYIGKLRERCGENEYTHTFRFMTDGNPGVYLDEVAARFYDAEGSEEDCGYWHKGGTVFVEPQLYREIPRDFYIQCHEFGAVENA